MPRTNNSKKNAVGKKNATGKKKQRIVKKHTRRHKGKKMRGGSSINLLTSFGTSAGATTVGIVSGQTNDVSPNVYNQPIVSPIIGFV